MKVVQLQEVFKTLHDDYGKVETSHIYAYERIADADLLLISTKDIYYSSYYSVNQDLKQFIHNCVLTRSEIEEYLSRGRDAIVFIDGKLDVFEVESDSFGRGNELTPESLAVKKIIPHFENLIRSKQIGVNITPSPEVKNPFNSTIGNDGIFKYNFDLNSNEMDLVLFRINDLDKVVGGVKFVGKGRLIFLPSIATEVVRKLDKDVRVFDLIYKFILKASMVKPRISGYIEPEWLRDLKILDQAEIESKELSLLADLNNIKAELGNVNTRLKEIADAKSILSTSGELLENQIKQIFKEIGFNLVEPDQNFRVDIILEFNDQIIVCEVKGLNGSAAERNAVQLEKWVSDYRLEKEIIPKGLLIVNGFRGTPIAERTEPVFPHAMLDYVLKREIACLSTHSLLYLYCRFLTGELDSLTIWERLYKTNGIVNI